MTVCDCICWHATSTVFPLHTLKVTPKSGRHIAAACVAPSRQCLPLQQQQQSAPGEGRHRAGPQPGPRQPAGPRDPRRGSRCCRGIDGPHLCGGRALPAGCIGPGDARSRRRAGGCGSAAAGGRGPRGQPAGARDRTVPPLVPPAAPVVAAAAASSVASPGPQQTAQARHQATHTGCGGLAASAPLFAVVAKGRVDAGRAAVKENAWWRCSSTVN